MLSKDNPLLLPIGSVRAILALGVVACFSYGCMITGNYEALGLIAVMVMKDYFDTRK